MPPEFNNTQQINLMKYNELTTRKARVQFIREKLSTDPKWATRGVLRIYQCQTTDEQQADTTHHNNGVGFNGADAQILSSLAKQLIAGRQLSERQLAVLHRRIQKYAAQLEQVSVK